MLILDPRIGGIFSARNILIGGIIFFVFYLLVLPASPAQAALAGFVIGAAAWLRLISRGQLENIAVERTHRPRVFEEEKVPVVLRFSRGEGLPVRLLEIQDQFVASLQVNQRQMIPVLAEGWEVLLHYEKAAERHRGLYSLGPVSILAGDPLGVFYEERELPCVTHITVYPHADPLPDYKIPGPQAPGGASLDSAQRVGLGEEVLAVREYHSGDPPQRVHWRTSARRQRLHVIQLDAPLQVELAVMLDLSRQSRLGLGAESTTELGIGAAVSLLTRAHDARHRFSLTYSHLDPVYFPAGSGMAHLHLLLDRLAIMNPAGETDFWATCGPRALMLPTGSRAVFIVSAFRTPPEQTGDLFRRLTSHSIAVDCVLIDEHDFIKIYRDQEIDIRKGRPSFDEIAQTLKMAGARVFPLSRNVPGLNVTKFN